jgi:hypothetical protein
MHILLMLIAFTYLLLDDFFMHRNRIFGRKD